MASRTSRRIWQMSQESVHQLVALLKRLRIRCDLKKSDAVYYATDAQAVDATSSRVRASHHGPDSKRSGSAPATFAG